jgi:hypothetical protein
LPLNITKHNEEDESVIHEDDRFVCVKCYVKYDKEKFSGNTRIMFTGESNKHDKDAKLMKCSVCGDKYWVWTND